LRERERNVREKKDVQTTSRQPENLSRFNDDKRKPDQETVATSGEDVESKKCQGPRLPRDHGVDGRASQAVRSHSYTLSLFFTEGHPGSALFYFQNCNHIKA